MLVIRAQSQKVQSREEKKLLKATKTPCGVNTSRVIAKAAASVPDAGTFAVRGCVRAAWNTAHPGSACCRMCTPGKTQNSDHGPNCNDVHNVIMLSMGGM